MTRLSLVSGLVGLLAFGCATDGSESATARQMAAGNGQRTDTATPEDEIVPDSGYAGSPGDLNSDQEPASATAGAYLLTVLPTEYGSISLEPAGGSYAPGTEVTVTAVPEAGYILSSWSGDVEGRSPTQTVVVTCDMEIGGLFEPGVTIELAEATHGSYTVSPPIAAGEGVPFGTELTIEATPDPGYVLDSTFKMTWIIEPFWGYYLDESFTSPHTVTADPSDGRFLIYGGSLSKYVLGAYFVPDDRWGALEETLNVVYAQPGNKPLQYDVYSPDGAEGLPIVVIIHGGGWSLNNEDIMRGQARYLASSGRYVVASIDYRLLSDPDDPAPQLPQLIEDVFGAVAHIQEHAAEYGGDPQQLAITGDSAGGHLAASVTILSDFIGAGAYDGQLGSQFLPTYIPADKSVAAVRTEIMGSVLASAPSYGAFDNAAWDPAISPLRNIPLASDRVLPPQHLQVGSEDATIPPSHVQAYADALEAAGQEAEFLVIEGASHAYFDWKPEAGVQETFAAIGEPALDLMLEFFDKVFYPQTTGTDAVGCP